MNENIAYNNFYLYDNGSLCDRNKLNHAGKLLRSLVQVSINKKTFPSFIKKIYVTSQYRPPYIDKNGNVIQTRHSTNKAIDVVCEPLWSTPFLWHLIHCYTYANDALSLHNRHIHIDFVFNLNNKIFIRNKKTLEILKDNIIYFSDPDTNKPEQLQQVYTLYQIPDAIRTTLKNIFYIRYNENQKFTIEPNIYELYFKETVTAMKESAEKLLDIGSGLLYFIPITIFGYIVYTLYNKGETTNESR